MRLPEEMHEEHDANAKAAQTNWLRAAVLGANDGIVSIAALVVGVAGASTSSDVILISGIAGLLAGALSMAVGEYISVSSQRDTEMVMLEKERTELEEHPERELAELAMIYVKKGLKRSTAERVAQELTTHDAFTAHVEAELGFHPGRLTNPWHAAFASAASFFSGAVIPLAAIMIPPTQIRIPATFAAVLIALAITGLLSARVSGADTRKVMTRVIIGGILAMLITFGIGRLFGVAGL